MNLKCKKCEQEKPECDFHNNVRSKTKRQKWCKSCQLAAGKFWRDGLTEEKRKAWVQKIKEWQKNNPEKVAMYNERAKLKRLKRNEEIRDAETQDR